MTYQVPQPRIETFRVMDTHGSTLNKVLEAANERASDSVDVRIEKRRQEAMQKMLQWGATYYQDASLQVVGCDWRGEIIHP